jgi:hypothetical protein
VTKVPNYLRDARIHDVIAGIFSWLWLLGSLAGIAWLLGALFGDFSWLITIGLLVGAQFAKAVHREYRRASQKAIEDGIAAGQIYIDANKTARPVDSAAGAA